VVRVSAGRLAGWLAVGWDVGGGASSAAANNILLHTATNIQRIIFGLRAVAG
jgi:hypothetical protein